MDCICMRICEVDTAVGFVFGCLCNNSGSVCQISIMAL